MSVSEYPVKKAAAARVEKFTTQEQIVERLAVLNAMQFKAGRHGIGSRDLEVKRLYRRLKQLQNLSLL